jgi:hypothetical protein
MKKGLISGLFEMSLDAQTGNMLSGWADAGADTFTLPPSTASGRGR